MPEDEEADPEAGKERSEEDMVDSDEMTPGEAGFVMGYKSVDEEFREEPELPEED